MFDKKIRETVKHIIELNPPGHYNRQRFPAVLVDDCKNLDCSSVLCPIRHKIIGPDMVSMRGSETGTGTVIEPQTTSFGLLLGNLEPLLTPDTLHPLVVYLPTIPSQQGRYPSVSVTPIADRQDDDCCPEDILIIPDPQNPPLGGSRLTYHPAGTPLGYLQLLLQVFNASAAPGGA